MIYEFYFIGSHFQYYKSAKLIFSSTSAYTKLCISQISRLISITTMNIMTNYLTKCLNKTAINVSWTQERQRDGKSRVIRCYHLLVQMSRVQCEEDTIPVRVWQCLSFSQLTVPQSLAKSHTMGPLTTRCSLLFCRGS